jgi:uncharacterized membrane protein YphA (DoxX/SURF4 family)
MKWYQSFLVFFARLLFSGALFLFCFETLGTWNEAVAYLVDHGMHATGFPSAGSLLGIVLVCLILVAILLFIGLYTRIAAFILLLFSFCTAMQLHWFLEESGSIRAAMAVGFVKNIGIVAGLLLLIACGSGMLSVDSARRKRKERSKGAISPQTGDKASEPTREWDKEAAQWGDDPAAIDEKSE